MSLIKISYNVENHRMIAATSLAKFIEMQIQASQLELSVQILENLLKEKGLVFLYVLTNISELDLNYIGRIFPDRFSEILISSRNHLCTKMAEEYFLDLDANSGVFNGTKCVLCSSILGIDLQSITMEESLGAGADIIYEAIESIINNILSFTGRSILSKESNLIKILYFFLFLVKQNERFKNTIIPLIATLINFKIFVYKNASYIIRSIENRIVNLPKKKCVDILNYVYRDGCISVFNALIKNERIEIILEIFLKIDKGSIEYLNGGYGNTTLHLICSMRNNDCCMQMYNLMEPASVCSMINCQNEKGNTPLMECIFSLRCDVAITLIRNYADKIDFTLVNKKGNTFFSNAVNAQSKKTLFLCMQDYIPKEILVQMADVKNKTGVTGRMIAERARRQEVLALIE